MQYTFSHPYEVRVRYGETDQMGYCYYGNYATFFEVGRVEALRSLGLSYKKLEEIGVMLPVSHFEIDYLKPAFYDDLLTVQTKIAEIAGARIFFEYEVYNENKQLLCKGKTTLVFVNKESMKPCTPPEMLTELLNAFINE